MNDFISNYTPRFETQVAQQSGAVNANQTTNTVQLGNGQANLLELKVGDMFQGEIIAVAGEEVQLALLNGQYLTARLEGQVQMAIGQLLNFQVQSNDGLKIVLKPVYQNLLQQQVGEAALKAANLPVNAKNLRLVSAMIEQGLPIDKNTLPHIYRQVLLHPEHDLSSLLKMYKLKLPITEENITQFQQYKNLEHKLLDGVKEVSEEIQKLYDTLGGKEENSSILTINNPPMLQKANQFMEQIIRILVEERKNDVTMVSQNEELQGISMNNVVDEPVLSEQQLFHQNPTVLSNEQVITQQISLESADDVLHILEQDKIDIKLFCDLLQGDNFQLQKLPEEEKAKIYCSSAFRRLLQNTMQKDWMLTPQEIGEENQVERLYRRLLQTCSRFADVMQETAQGLTMQPRAAQNMQQNLEFMNQMNQMFQYVQLPIKLTDGQAHGELYVYTNKKHMAQNEGTLTALLQLDMEHLGSMDIHVSLQTKDNKITTKFFLEEDVIELVESHLESLEQRLKGQGYVVKTLVQERKDSKTVLERLEEHVTGTLTPLSYQAFDIRA